MQQGHPIQWQTEKQIRNVQGKLVIMKTFHQTADSKTLMKNYSILLCPWWIFKFENFSLSILFLFACWSIAKQTFDLGVRNTLDKAKRTDRPTL